VADDGGAVDAERGEQLLDVGRHVVEVVGNDRLRRAAEADLVGHDDAETGVAEGLNRAAEVEAAEVHSVEQHHRSAVRSTSWRDVHIGHPDVLAVESQGQVRDGIRIGDLVIGDAAWFDVGGSRGQRLGLRAEEPCAGDSEKTAGDG